MSARRPTGGRAENWVLAPGSLSARLQRAHPPLAVRRLHQGPSTATAHERAALGQRHVHGRWVLLTGAGQPLVFARSATTPEAVRGPWQSVAGLGTRPLADVLFTRPGVRRSALVLAWLPPRHPEARQVERVWREAGGAAPRGVWRRHSVFWREGAPLIVSEYFVPGLLAQWPATAGIGWHSHLQWRGSATP